LRRWYKRSAKRSGPLVHLPNLFHDLACRLRLPKDAHLPMSTVAAARGQMRRDRGYSPAMLVEESRLFQVVTFQTLHRRQGELDQDQVLLDVMVIRGRGGFSAHAIRVLLGNATSSARSLGATLNSPRLSVGHDAAWYGAVRSGVRISCPAPRHKSGNGQLVSVRE
jgi:hypothetical protein